MASRHTKSALLSYGAAILATALVVALLAGCGSSARFRLEFSIPQPLVQPVPLRIATYYPPEFKNYVFEDELENHGKFRIDMVDAHVTLFATVFDAMFEKAEEVGNFNDLTPDMHGLISPSVEEVQISVPRQTRSEYYEVWIRYKVQVIDKSGKLIHTWPLAAYGKTNRGNYTTLANTSAYALHDATELALRDAAARITFAFTKEPTIQNWIAEVTGTT